MKNFFIIIIILFPLIAGISYGETIYVDVNNTSGTEDGSQAYPFNTIMEGIEAASDGETVQVAAGTYYENVVMKAGVDLIGAGADLVLIDGGGTGHVIEGADRCEIAGFTITNSGPDQPSSGIYCPTNCSMLIEKNIISGCTNGIRCHDSSTQISSNLISANGNPGNSYTDYAICCNNSSLTISNNLIIDNLEVAVYAAWSGSDSAVIINNTIVDNIFDHGVWCYESSPTIKNNIITGNFGGIVAIYSSFPEISYNDVWNNTWANYIAQTESVCEPGIGDISVDPLFLAAANDDYRLNDSSPCISAGVLSLEVPDTDIEGNPRPDPPFSCPDMGAYENPLGAGQFLLTLNAQSGGTTDPLPGAYNCCADGEVEIEAIPDEGNGFSHWTGDVPPGHEYDNPLTLTIDTNKSLTAHFMQQWELTIASGEGGTTDPAPGTYFYDSVVEITITAIPDSGYRFDQWTGDVPQGHEFDNPIEIFMDSDKLITANFVREYTLTLLSSSGGTTNPAPGTYTYGSGTVVSIEAVPSKGYEFSQWIGDIPSGHEKDNPIDLTIDSDKAVTANFKKIRPWWQWECFIVTSAYGSPVHPYVKVLRDFRDRYLMSNKLGREFVDQYYKYSPFAADLIERHKALRIVVQINLFPVVVFCYSIIHFGPFVTGVIIFLIVVIPIFFMLFIRRS